MNVPLSTEEKLTQLGNELFSVPAILRFIDAEARGAHGGSERTQIELIARLVRAQQAEIERLKAAIDEHMRTVCNDPKAAGRGADDKLWALVTDDVSCEHEWVSARNEAVTSGEICKKCFAIRAEDTRTTSRE